MLAFINDLSVVKEIKFSLPFSGRQKHLGQELYKYLGDEDSNSAESNSNCLHKFIVCIFDTPTSEAPEGRSLFLAVLALRAVNGDGSFIRPEHVTPDLARLRYLCNVAILVEGQENEEREGGFLQCVAIQSFCLASNRLSYSAVDIANKAFYDDSQNNFLGDLDYKQKFATKWVLSSPKAPQITWDTDAKWIAFDGRKIVLNDLRYGLKAVIERCHDILHKMVGEYNFVADLPTEINDNHGKKGMNHCFFHGLPPTQAKFFQLAIKHTQMALSVGKGREAVWHEENTKILLGWIGDLNDNLAILTYWTGAITIRGTELMEMQVRNSVEDRNVFVNDGSDGLELFLMQYYSKTCNRYERHESRMHMPAPQVQELLLVYLYCIRPAEAAMVCGVYGEMERDLTEK